jgi:hypothetical protein
MPDVQNPESEPVSLEAKRARLIAAMTERLGHEPVRRDIEALDESSIDYLLRHYGAGPRVHVF